MGTRYTSEGTGNNSTYVEIYHIVSKGNSHKLTLQTKYNNNWVDAGETANIPNGGTRQVNIEYIPTGVNYCRSDFDIGVICNGSNTTSSTCQKSGQSYRIKVKNNSALAKLSVVGWTN